MINLEVNDTLARIVDRQAELRGEKIALVYNDKFTTFRELADQSNQVANQLIKRGSKPGDRVALLDKNSDSFYALFAGCSKAGCVLTPINSRLSPAEISYILKDCEADIFFIGEEFVEISNKAVSSLGSSPEIVALSENYPEFCSYEAWRDSSPASAPEQEICATDVLLQLYTSGTTGYPKGVCLTNANYTAYATLVSKIEDFQHKEGEVILNAMPLFHVAGLNAAVAALINGTKTIVMSDVVPSLVLTLIEKYKINYAFFVPVVIQALLDAPEIEETDLSSFKILSYGGSPISEELLLRASNRFQCRFLQGYGMTESAGAATFLLPEMHHPGKDKLTSCGNPIPGIDIRIADADGNYLPPGELGEIILKSPTVMQGYWRRPDETSEALRDGWLYTGDAGVMDEDGFIYVKDRVKNMILTGGENVYPAEVENLLLGYPGVLEVAVFGVPDETWGEAIKAQIVPVSGEQLDAKAIMEFLRDRIANYKIPKSIDFISSIPRNAAGKILHRELRKPFWEGKSRNVS